MSRSKFADFEAANVYVSWVGSGLIEAGTDPVDSNRAFEQRCRCRTRGTQRNAIKGVGRVVFLQRYGTGLVA